jgi:CBS domain-containing protein
MLTRAVGRRIVATSDPDPGLPRMQRCDRAATIGAVTTFAPASERHLDRAVVAAAMTGGVISCGPETPLPDVARLMAERRVHAIYVFEDAEVDGDRTGLWGLVSDLDLVAAARTDFAALTARDAAVTPLVTVRGDDSLDHAAQLLAENGVSHLAVLDPLTARPVGVLSTLDIAGVVAGQSAA